LPDRDDPPDTIGLAPLLRRLLPDGELVYCKVCDEDYNDPGPELPSEGEFSIEVVAQKRAPRHTTTPGVTG
jgi:hypothetical protein